MEEENREGRGGGASERAISEKLVRLENNGIGRIYASINYPVNIKVLKIFKKYPIVDIFKIFLKNM